MYDQYVLNLILVNWQNWSMYELYFYIQLHLSYKSCRAQTKETPNKNDFFKRKLTPYIVYPVLVLCHVPFDL